MIPPEWDKDTPCFGSHILAGRPEKKRHEGHRTERDCYLSTWHPPPQPWARRRPTGQGRRFMTGGTLYHLTLGIRVDSGTAQCYCGTAKSVRGPFDWSPAPDVDNPKRDYCQPCLGYWVRRRSLDVTVRIDHYEMKLSALRDLVAAVAPQDPGDPRGAGGLPGDATVRFEQSSVGDVPAMLVTMASPPKNPVRFLLAGTGMIRL